MKKSYFYILGGLGVVFIGGFIYLRKRTKDLQNQKATATRLQNLELASSNPLAPINTKPETTQTPEPNLGKAKKIETELKKNYKIVENWKKTKKISQMSMITGLATRNKKLLADLDGLGYKWDNSTQNVIKK